MTDCTIIPDIHADVRRLNSSLRQRGPHDRIAFLGDFIDAGSAVAEPDDAAVLKLVRRACEDDMAVAVMGNHELNAILFHRCDSDGRPLRERDAKNLKQHRSFCDRFGIGTEVARGWTDWFLTLPLWQDMDGLRLVHACWSSAAIATIAERRPDARLKEADLEEVAAKQSAFARAVNLLLTGPEVPLPQGVTFIDGSGHVRSDVRVAWWRAGAPTWRAASLSVPDPMALPDDDVQADGEVEFYGPDHPPVLVGHYKMQGDPKIEVRQAACLDYPSRPCVYRWSGEASLRQDELIEISF